MTTVGRIHLVLVPTTDPDRSIAFYESLGFAKRADFPYGDGSRWIELFPPDGVCGIALSGVSDGVGVDTGLLITVADIAAAHAEQTSAGRSPSPLATPGSDVTVQLGGATVTGPTPSMFRLHDPDGNALLIIGD
ncbi:VOC family protein [Conexibacter woesei]|uniref:VOC family protein n=1 Tax=Conexibacter woesei TaxID=191495 RepID=UPI00041857D3|nr:VOC family protein [Conexibacter woesei]